MSWAGRPTSRAASTRTSSKWWGVSRPGDEQEKRTPPPRRRRSARRVGSLLGRSAAGRARVLRGGRVVPRRGEEGAGFAVGEGVRLDERAGVVEADPGGARRRAAGEDALAPWQVLEVADAAVVARHHQLEAEAMAQDVG